MYYAFDDPYCYPGTNVLINKLGIRVLEDLEAFEEEITRERAAEPLPSGRLSVRHFRAIHRHLFQDVYTWAGQLRTVRIFKEGSAFGYPEHIPAELRRVFSWLKDNRYLRDLERPEFAARAAHFLAELNAIHAFRDGNGRAQFGLMTLLASKAGHVLALDRLDPPRFLEAMIASFHGREADLAAQLERLAE